MKKFLCILFLFFASILFYPIFASFWNAHHQLEVIDAYETMTASLSEEEILSYLKQADSYNQDLFNGNPSYPYEEMLSISDTMASIEIPSIDIKLPVYHGTSEEVLEKGVGHLEDSSLPTGGRNTHCVLTGHTGLPGSALFTDLVKLEKEDIFIIHVFNETLVYKIDQIEVVEPDEVDDLAIIKDHDYVTLITCTPYGVNDHRLLVRGTRIHEEEKNIETKHTSTFTYVEIIEIVSLILTFILFFNMIRMMKKC